MRPREGFSPTTPQHEAGTRIDPPPCGPSSSFVASLNPLSACYNFVLSLPRPLTQIKTRPPRSAMLGNRADHGQKPREEGGRDYPLKLGPELGLARSGLTSFWNDLDELAEILRSLHAQPTRGAVRLGVDEGYTRRCLPDILARFAVTHPQTTVEVSRAASCELVPRLKAGELDLMLCGLEPRQWPAVEVWRGPLAWIIADAQSRHVTIRCRCHCHREIALFGRHGSSRFRLEPNSADPSRSFPRAANPPCQHQKCARPRLWPPDLMGPGNGILRAETAGRLQAQNAGERPEFGSQTALRPANCPATAIHLPQILPPRSIWRTRSLGSGLSISWVRETEFCGQRLAGDFGRRTAKTVGIRFADR